MSQDEVVLCVPRKHVECVLGTSGLADRVYDAEWIEQHPLDALFRLTKSEYIRWRPRHECEKDPTLKQIIPYIVVSTIDFGEKEPLYLSYYRTIKSGEERLKGRRSFGVGGHVTQPETVLQAFHRELNEELMTHGAVFNSNLVGFVNNESDEVGQVHLGVLFVVDFPMYHPPKLRCDSMVEPKWNQMDQLHTTRSECEVWSQLVIDYLTEDL
jgi:predicted NUDIX family phosphoesterase